MSFQGDIKRLKPQRLILDPLDGALLRRGMQRAPRPMGDLSVRALERLAAEESPGGGTALSPALTLVTLRTPSGFLVFFDMVQDPQLGHVASGLAAGRHVIELSGRHHQPLRLTVSLGDVPPPFEALPDAALVRSAVRAVLEPSFVHPILANGIGTRIGGVIEAADPSHFDDVSLVVRAGGADFATYRLDARGQWLVALDNAALTFAAGPAPRRAPVALHLLRGTTELTTATVQVAQDQLTTAPNFALPSP